MLVPTNTDSDCRTDEGITIGLIDGVIAICRVLRGRDLSSPNIQEALLDMSGDEDIAFVLAAYNQVDSHTKRSSDMSIRIRTVNGMRVALCAAETDPAPGDIYLDDADHYALAAKFMRDWQESGLMEKSVEGWVEWPVMDSQKVRDAKTELEQWHAAHAGKGLTLGIPLDDEDNGRFMAPIEIGKQDTPKLVSDTPLYDWDDPRIPEDCEWLATNDNGKTMAFVTEPSKDHPYRELRGDCWGVMCFTETNETGTKYGYFDAGTFVFNSPGPLIGYVEKRPTINPLYDWSDPHIPEDCMWLATNDDKQTNAFIYEPTNTHAGERMKRRFGYIFTESSGKVSNGTFMDVGIHVFDSPESLIGKKEKRPSPKWRQFALANVISDGYFVEDLITQFIQEHGVNFSLYNWSDPRIPEDCMWLATSNNGNALSFGDEPSKNFFEEKATAWAVFDSTGNRETADKGIRIFSSPLLTGFKEKRPFATPSYYWGHPYVQYWLRLKRGEIEKRPLLQERADDTVTPIKITKEQKPAPITEEGLIAAGYTKNEHSAMASNFYKQKYFAEGRGIRSITFDFSRDGDCFCRVWDGGGYSARMAIESMEDLYRLEKMLLL